MALTAAQRRTLNWAALAAAAAAFVWLLGPVLTPFVIGAVLAYALHPLVEQLAARRVPRLAAVILVEIGAIAALAALVLLIVPILSKELPLLNEQLPVLVDRINRNVTPWLKQMGIDVTLDGSSLRAILHQVPRRQLEQRACCRARVGTDRRQHPRHRRRLPDPDSGRPLLPVDRLAVLRAARDRARAAAPARAGRPRSPAIATPCSASTCAASCSSC